MGETRRGGGWWGYYVALVPSSPTSASDSEMWVFRTYLNIYNVAFFAVQWTKAKILKPVLNALLKL